MVFAARAALDSSFVAELKQGMPPEFTVPETVRGKTELPPLPFETDVIMPWALTVTLEFV
jgi:hypothetical protein